MKLIFGQKGSGKTEKLVNQAHAHCAVCKGVLVYLDQSNHRMHVLDRKIRLVDMSEYRVKTVEQFYAFVKGMLALNFDIEHVYCDELFAVLSISHEESENFIEGLIKLEKVYNIEFTIAVTADTIPENLEKYQIA
ncbi:MAG: ATP-binding protein [Clostridia bacterium]|nr:ATP-binding protein [Clostridia bacterium]